MICTAFHQEMKGLCADLTCERCRMRAQIAALTADLATFQDAALELNNACSRRDQLDDKHRKAILDLIGDAVLAADNPSWRRVIEALASKLAAARGEEREACLACVVKVEATAKRRFVMLGAFAIPTLLAEIRAAIEARGKAGPNE